VKTISRTHFVEEKEEMNKFDHKVSMNAIKRTCCMVEEEEAAEEEMNKFEYQKVSMKATATTPRSLADGINLF
jgi:hypothetical protein